MGANNSLVEYHVSIWWFLVYYKITVILFLTFLIVIASTAKLY